MAWCFRGFGAGVQSRFFQSAVLAKENLVSLGQMNLTNELVQMGNWNQAESIDKNKFEVHRVDSVNGAGTRKIGRGCGRTFLIQARLVRRNSKP
jgi:hypothetical protein